MSKIVLTVDDVPVYTSGVVVTPPGPTPPPPTTPPPPPPLPGVLSRYDACYSGTSKIQGMSDAEAAALIAAGRADANLLNNLRMWFYYKGITSWRGSVNTSGVWVYKIDVEINRQWYTKIESASDPFDKYNPNMPCPWRVP